MRLDKFLSITGTCTRTEAKRAVRAGAVTVNGKAATSADLSVEPEKDTVLFSGKKVIYRKYTYIMLNKPEGYVSATEDGNLPTVLELLPPEVRLRGLFPCGRLDRNTVGLMLITDNGALSHRLLAPRSHVAKTYRFASRFPVSEEEAEYLRQGVTLEDGYVTMPAQITLDEKRDSGLIVLNEGKYHQIKRMFEAIGNKITFLERIQFGCLSLDPSLARGEWRYLSGEEIRSIES